MQRCSVWGRGGSGLRPEAAVYKEGCERNDCLLGRESFQIMRLLHQQKVNSHESAEWK